MKILLKLNSKVNFKLMNFKSEKDSLLFKKIYRTFKN
jgi:hypothetical protein